VFSGRIRVSASKQGYVTATQQIRIPSQDVLFQLESTEASVDLTGNYTLTLIADSTCAALPDVARRRTYSVAVAPDPRSPFHYVGTISGATAYRASNAPVFMGVNGITARFGIGDYGDGFTEDLGSSTVEIYARGETIMQGPSSSGSFDGSFTYCDGLPQTNWGTYWSCPVPPVYCEGSHHFTLTRR
jgi:hypothetical protein